MTSKEKIRFVEYNNKNKKGLYINIKLGNMKKEKSYKYDGSKPVDYFKDLAQREEKKKEKYKDWLQRKKLTRIQEQFKKGITKKQIKLEELATIEGQRKVLKALFEPLVHDKGLLEIIIANKHKLKNRFAYKMNIRDKQNVLGTINDIGNRTPDEIWDTYGRNLTYRPGRVITQTKEQIRIQNEHKRQTKLS